MLFWSQLSINEYLSTIVIIYLNGLIHSYPPLSVFNSKEEVREKRKNENRERNGVKM